MAVVVAPTLRSGRNVAHRHGVPQRYVYTARSPDALAGLDADVIAVDVDEWPTAARHEVEAARERGCHVVTMPNGGPAPGGADRKDTPP